MVSHDIALAIAKRNKGRLKASLPSFFNFYMIYEAQLLSILGFFLQMFKLEDVAMGIWIAELKKDGLKVTYIKEQRVYNEGCQDGYIVAHYQSPREMLCLWQKLQEQNAANCCTDR